MKRSLRLFAGTVSAVMGLAWSAGALDYISIVDFNSMTVGEAPVGWTVSSGSALISASGHNSGNGLSISSSSSVLNTGGNPRSGLVWTDFWVKPVKCTEDPSSDNTATAQIFVNSASKWSTLSSAGVQTYTSALLASPDDVISDPLDGNWHHVSVLHNYNNRTWSLYVDEKPLAFDLGFITTDDPVNDKWFKVETLVESVSMLDDFCVKDSIPSTLAAVDAPGTENGITPAVALTYFGTVGDPRPAPTTVGSTPGQVSITFTPNSALQYQLIGGSTPDATSPLSELVDGTALISSPLTENTAFSGNVRFYKIATVSPVDGDVSLVSSETYACFKQDRPGIGRWYFTGLPVTMVGGADTLAGQAGEQLRQGLSSTDLLVKDDATYEISGSAWQVYGGGVANEPIPAGSGVAIRRKGAATTAYVSGLWSSTTIAAVTLRAGWNSLVWPYEVAATEARADFPLAVGNQFAVQRGASGSIVIGQCISTDGSTKWIRSDGNPLQASEWPQPGEGFMFKYGGGGDQWQPTRTP